jgi:uncharacterized protein (TIGR02099 family)
LIFWNLVLVAGVLTLLRIALFCLDFYKAELEVKFTELLNAPVKIEKIHAHLRHGLKPELILKNISISDLHAANKTAIELQEIRVGLDLLDILKQQQIIPATWITLVGAKLSVIHKPDGSLTVLGLQGGDEQPTWLLQGRHYQLLQSDITWLDEKNHRRARTFQHVDISIKNDLRTGRHRLNLLSVLPRAYGDSVRISADFTGDVFSSEALNGRFFIAGKNLHFAKFLLDELPLKLRLKGGDGDFELWGSVQNLQLTALSGNFQSENLTVQRADEKKLQFTHLNSQFDWRNHANNWSLVIDNFNLGLPQKNYLPAQFYVGSQNKAAQHFSATIKALDLEAVQILADFFGKDLPDFKKLAGLSVKGQLSDTTLFADLKQQQYKVAGEFKHLSIAAPAPYPSLQNLSGTINGNQTQGVLSLSSQNANFIAQPMFRTPLAMTQLAGQLFWQQFDKNWQLSGANLKLNTPYLQTTNNLKLTIPKDDQSLFLDLQTAFFNLDDVSHAKIYYPVTRLRKDLLSYLDQAFITGKVNRGDMLFYGYLKDFPFINHEGVFQVLFDFQDVTMKYAEGWPVFDHLNAKILFEDDSLEVNLKHAKAEEVTLNNAKITIPSFTDSQYVIVEQGKIATEINAGLNFLRHTPVKLPLKSVSEQLAIQGNTEIDLALKVPLTEKVEPKVLGSAAVSGAKLNVLAIDLPITNLTGMFRFTENGFYSDTLNAFSLGYPLQTKVDLKSDHTLISVAGKTSVKELEQQFKLPAQNLADGASIYSAQLSLPFAEKTAPELILHSNLQGVSLALPDTLEKTALDSKDLDIKFKLTAAPLLPVNVLYDKQLNANLLIKKADKSVAGAAIDLSGFKNLTGLENPQVGEFKVSIKQAQFSAPVWIAALDKMQMSSDKAQLLTDLEISTPHLLWSGQQLGEFALNLHQNSKDWSGTFACVAATGRLQIPVDNNPNSKIKLDLSQLDLSSLMRLKLPKKDNSLPTRLPLFEIDSQAVLLRGINLGKLAIDTERNGKAIKFKQFLLSGKDETLSLTGDWQVFNNKEACSMTANPLQDWQSCSQQEITRVNGQFSSKNLGVWLKKLQLNDDIEETEAKIDLALYWQGAPYQFALSTLSGSMDINLEAGRISSIEPGFGRLLGVLAMEQWLRRLQLDFGDIYKKGLSFNEIKGHFELHNGKANTNNLTVNAVPATINLTGELNLYEQTLDQQISVIPKSLDAVPIAGTIVDKITTIVTQTLTGEYEAGYYSRSKYRVKGKWNDLNVLPLHEQDGLFTKTWRGLTDFSWITQQKQD